MKNREISPALVVPFIVVVLLIFAYFFLMKPKMEADSALANFNSEEAKAKRDPDKKQLSPEGQAKVKELLATEQHINTGGTARKRRRDD